MESEIKRARIVMTGRLIGLRAIPFILAALMMIGPGAEAWAQQGVAQQRGSGLPLPRFVSLRADEVNMRTGPSVRYPVDWVYRRPGLPVEVIAEFDTWRKIRDWRGSQGWVHQSLLSARRTFIVTGKTRTLRSRPDSQSRPVALLEDGVIGNLLECPGGPDVWCRISANGHEGWLRRIEFWGTHPEEAVK